MNFLQFFVQKRIYKRRLKRSVTSKTISIVSMNNRVKKFFRSNRNTTNFVNRIIENVCQSNFLCFSIVFFSSNLGSDLISKIPSFWISVFLNHPQLSSHLDQNDENILQHLKRIDVDEVSRRFFVFVSMSFDLFFFFQHEDIKSGYRIKFVSQNFVFRF